ncbi:hypothetical protein [Desulfofustis limnaeus]|nr:hypothetical protein [Desulfofustis limnaeus]MDX9894076.1 hypothetical protein [Desulfofustis sp.]
MPEVRELVAPLLLVAAFLGLALFCQYFTAGLAIHLEITAAQDDILQVFWRHHDDSFQGEKSLQTTLRGDELTVFRATLPMAVGIDYIRLDIGIKPGTAILSKAEVAYGFNYRLDLLQWLRDYAPISTSQVRLLQQDNHLVLQSQGNDPFIEIPTPIRKRDIFAWNGLVLASAGIGLLLCLLLQQDLMKGAKNQGWLQISLSDGAHLVLPDFAGTDYLVGPHMSRQVSGQETIYGVGVTNLDPALVADLLHRFKQANGSATIRFQYNRAGDI